MRFSRVLWWRIRYALWRLHWRVLFRIAEWRTFHGIAVGVGPLWDDRLEEPAFEKIDTALSLIAAYAPLRLQRVARDVRRVWVERAAYAPAYYIEHWEMCVIDVRFLTDAQTSPAKVAATLVHEATHARLFKCGVRYAETARRRVEDICVAQSASFARRLPDGEMLACDLEASQPTESHHWSDHNLYRRIHEAKLEELDEAPLAAWLKRLLRRLLVWRAA